MEKLIAEQKPNLALEIDGKPVINQYGDHFEKIFEIIRQDDYTFFIQFQETEEPEQIEFSGIVREWEKRNALSSPIHLYVKNSRRS